MKIIIDDKIPYIRGEFEKWAEVEYLGYDKITTENIRDAEVLIIRTRTHCDASLLERSNIKMIATATIGTDHIDVEWCSNHGIKVVSAPGCNALAVAEWVSKALCRWATLCNATLSNETIAIVGYGHVGHEVEKVARNLGMGIRIVDPYIKGCYKMVEDVIKECRIITYHVPLTNNGHYPTYRMCDSSTLELMNKQTLLINAARGGIVNECALLHWLNDNPEANAAIDCWEGEPTINRKLAERAIIATPHIAGYSAEGKWRGTRMVVEAVKQQYNWKWNIEEATNELKNRTDDFEQLRITR